MLKTIIIATVAACVSTAALADPSPKQKAHSDAMKACGALWKEEKKTRTIAKGEGSAAWNTFRVPCVKEHKEKAKTLTPQAS